MLENLLNVIDEGMTFIFEGPALWLLFIITFPAWFIPWMIGTVIVYRRKHLQKD